MNYLLFPFFSRIFEVKVYALNFAATAQGDIRLANYYLKFIHLLE